MQARTLGKTGLDVSVVGFGGAPIGLLETEQQRVAGVLNLLLDRGVNLIDTAAGYRGSEEAIGMAVSDRRDEYWLVSKCGKSGDDANSLAWKPESLTSDIDRSLQRLKTDHLDVMLLHSCPLETLQRGEALAVLARARNAGKIRFVGFSGDNEAAAYAAQLDDVDVLQTSINICDQANLETVLPLARKHNVGVIAKRPIANAAWKNAADQPGFYKTYAETYTQRFAQMRVDLRELGINGNPADVWPELALRFTLSQPGVHSAIIGTTDPQHASANLRAIEKGALADEILHQLRTAFQHAERNAGEHWAAQM